VVVQLNLVAGRGGNEAAKVRNLREGVGAVKQALEIAAVRVKDHHMVEDPDTSATGASE
jgi:hypothetical protein